MSSTTKNDAIQQSLEQTKVAYRRLGKSGLQVSVPILGAMSFGLKAWQPWVLEEEQALPILKAAYDRGLNTWDTACNYSNGTSEQIIGKALKKYDIPRRKVVIMTKCYGVVADEPTSFAVGAIQKALTTKDYANQAGLSRKSIMASVDASLKRLGTTYIDVLQVHRFDNDTPVEETMLALHDLVRQGKVLYIGASSMWTYQFAQMQFCAEKNGWTKFISMQNHYNLQYREEEREMNKFCNATGVGLVPWSPLNRGHLARPAKDFGTTTRSEAEQEFSMFGNGRGDADLEIVKRVEEIAHKRGWKMAHVALAWTNKRVTSPIIGFSSVDRMEEAIEARGKTLTDEEEKYLEEPYLPNRIIGHF